MRNVVLAQSLNWWDIHFIALRNKQTNKQKEIKSVYKFPFPLLIRYFASHKQASVL